MLFKLGSCKWRAWKHKFECKRTILFLIYHYCHELRSENA